MKIFRFCSKILSLFLIILIILSTSGYVLADDLAPSEDDFIPSEILDTIETNSDISQTPTINSRAYVVIDRKSNTILIGKNENQRKKMASTTKIMTCLIVIENSNLSDVVTISKKAASTGGSRLGLKTGDTITVLDLLYGLMMRSGNDAAVALAEHVADSISEFATLMNNKAQSLRLLNTHFVTPHGLDEDEHYTTAYELALLSNYAMQNEIFAKIVGTKSYTITLNGYPKSLVNTNELLGTLNGVYGIKTGFTNGANRCLVTCCKRGEMDIICVVLGADSKKLRTSDSIKLIEYSFANFTYTNIEEIIHSYFTTWKPQALSTFEIKKGDTNYIDLTYESLPYPIIPVKNELAEQFHISIDYSNILTAPITKGTSIGKIILKLEDQIIYSGNIIINNDIRQKTVPDYLLYFFKNVSSIFNTII